MPVRTEVVYDTVSPKKEVCEVCLKPCDTIIVNQMYLCADHAAQAVAGLYAFRDFNKNTIFRLLRYRLE